MPIAEPRSVRPTVDGAVVLVDSNATTAAAIAAACVVPADGFVLTLQNGIGNVEALTAVLGEERVLGPFDLRQI